MAVAKTIAWEVKTEDMVNSREEREREIREREREREREG